MRLTKVKFVGRVWKKREEREKEGIDTIETLSHRTPAYHGLTYKVVN